MAAAFTATLGPKTGLRTIIITRYSSGYLGCQIYSFLNVFVCLLYKRLHLVILIYLLIPVFRLTQYVLPEVHTQIQLSRSISTIANKVGVLNDMRHPGRTNSCFYQSWYPTSCRRGNNRISVQPRPLLCWLQPHSRLRTLCVDCNHDHHAYAIWAGSESWVQHRCPKGARRQGSGPYGKHPKFRGDCLREFRRRKSYLI